MKAILMHRLFSKLLLILCCLQLSCAKTVVKTDSRDNKSIFVYEDFMAAEDPKDPLERSQFNPVVIYDDATREKRILTKFGVHPKIFPSGDIIEYFLPNQSPYFNYEKGKHGKSVIVDLSGKVQKEIPFHVTSISPDGTQLLVQPIYQWTPFDTGFEIYVYDLKTDKFRKVFGLDELPKSSEIESLLSPIWFPDGRRILFSILKNSNTKGETALHAFGVVDSNGSNFAQISPFMTDLWDYDISPDSKRIVYTKKLEGSDIPYGEIFVMELHGNLVNQLTNNKTFKHDPIWARDGNGILYTENRSQPPVTGKQTLMIINPDGSNKRRALPKTWRYYIGLFTPFFTTEMEHNADWWQPEKARRPN
jgi:hypothetical protein